MPGLQLLAGQVREGPLQGAAGSARLGGPQLPGRRQCPVPKAADTGREKIDLALLFALGMLCEDPDFESMKGSSFEADTV